jgi:protein AATF/BFR2
MFCLRKESAGPSEFSANRRTFYPLLCSVVPPARFFVCFFIRSFLLKFFVICVFVDDSSDEENENENEEEDEEKQEDIDEVMLAFQESQRQEMKKAKHTELQTKVWQRILALRIKMQGLVTCANSLPNGANAAKYQLAKHAEEAQKLLKKTGKEMLELQGILMKNSEEFAAVKVPATTPSVEEGSGVWWSYLAQLNQGSVTVEEEIINLWNKQANLQSGKSLKTLGRTIVEQVRLSLRQEHVKLLRRTQLNRADIVPLGEEEKQEYNENLFDDGEFYSSLLKTFLQTTGNMTTSRAIIREKKQKIHERRQNNLHMQIQDKLLNFMAPLASNVLPAMADPLFASLFGATPADAQE